jgi:hypothetical protein
VAEAADGTDERANSPLALARGTFGAPGRDQTVTLGRAAVRDQSMTTPNST